MSTAITVLSVLFALYEIVKLRKSEIIQELAERAKIIKKMPKDEYNYEKAQYLKDIIKHKMFLMSFVDLLYFMFVIFMIVVIKEFILVPLLVLTAMNITIYKFYSPSKKDIAIFSKIDSAICITLLVSVAFKNILY